jgi:uroporphyrinogen decarboxylase
LSQRLTKRWETSVNETGVMPSRERGAAVAAPLFLRTCRGEAVERTPVWIMRQAGRYLPEYRAIRERHDFLTTCRTPELACDITLQPVRRLGVDAAILFSDILVPLPGMGVDVEFTPGPHLARTVRSMDDVSQLRVPDPEEAMPFVLDAIRLVRRELNGQVPLIGFAGAPLTMAAYLVEGGTTRSFEVFKRLVYGAPDVAVALLRTCTDTVIAYLTAQVHAGADAVMLFDTWAGQLGPAQATALALPPVGRIVSRVRAAAEADGGRDLPIIYYAGDAAGWLGAAAATGADVIGIDWRLGLDRARATVGPDVVLQGNLDPGALLGEPDILRREIARVVAEAGGGAGRAARGHVFNLGHGILPSTPPDHARILVDTVRALTETH